MKPSLDLYTKNPGWWRRGLARVYGLAVGLRLWLYEAGLLKSRSLPAWVISVGNLTVGGTGKTPTVLLIARALAARQWRVAVLSRGYRGRYQDAVNLVSDGMHLLLGPSQAGDEAFLLAKSLPGVPVLVGRDRWLLGRYAVEKLRSQVLILDDGFQHLGLNRDVNLLLLDTEQPWGNGFLLPAGALREPKSQVGRATAFLLTRPGSGGLSLMEELVRTYPGRPVFAARHQPVSLSALDGESGWPPDYLKGRRVVAFCGLARPLSFLETLAGLGAEVVLFIQWPDHYQPQLKDVELIRAKARELGVSEAVTTSKDAVKLAGGAMVLDKEDSLRVWVLDVEMDLLASDVDFLGALAPREVRD
jgi:tetraacyldisaccharide 4'-kinase